MKSISPQLQSEIEQGKIAYIISVTMKDGVSIYYTNHDRPLTVDGHLYQPGAGLSRVRLIATGNQEVSTQSFESAWTFDIDETKALNGYYDDALVIFSWIAWEHPEYGPLEIFRGNLGMLNWSKEGFNAEIHNAIRKLQNPIGSYYTPFCRHNFGDSTDTNKSIPGGCNLNLGSFTFSGSVSAILTNKRKFIISGLASAQPNAYFSNGVMTWTSGLNDDRVSDVKVSTVDGYGSQIELYLPTTFDIQVGDSFTVVAGCDKTRDTCKTKFNNVVNFGGMPDLQPEINFR